MSCGDLFVVPSANPCLGVKEIFAGTNVTITGSIYTPTINATGSSGGGVTSLAYTTGINGSAATGAITLSNTGVTSIVAGTGIGVSGTGAVTVTNNGITSLIAGTGISVSGATITNTGITTLVSGSNITISGGNIVNVMPDPVFSNSMGFNGFGTISAFANHAYPYGSPTEYYPYMLNGVGINVNNTLGGKQFWATNIPGSSGAQVLRYRYDGIEAQQGSTGTTIPFLTFDNSTGLFGLSNTSNVVNSNIAGTGISLSGATGNVTITNTGIISLVAGTGISVSGATITNTGVTSLSLTGGGGLYNLGTATAPILGALVVDVLAGTGISVSPSSGNYTVTNTGVTSIVAGTGISISGATGAVTINNTGSSSPSMTAIFTPLINPGWTAIDGDVEILAAQLDFGISFTNLATAETIVVHFSCGPILGTSTAGPTNASYFAMKALVTPSIAGTPVDTPAYGQYVVDYGAVMGGDFIVILSKARGEFFSDSRFIKLYKMDLPAAPFSSAILPAIAVPTIYVNMYAM